MNGVGIFFNQLVDLERIGKLADGGKIQWITPLMAPDQSSVQNNRQEWATWRKRMPKVKFYPWIVCYDPEEAADRASYVVANYPSDGIVMNCEKSYESTGKWKARVLVERMMADPKLAGIAKLLSMPSTPAERYDMDYRTFERAGFIFAPQAYWNDYPDATPKSLYDSICNPQQIHVGRNYRLHITAATSEHWGLVVAWDGGRDCIMKDLASTKLHRIPVVRKQEGSFIYMTVAPGRAMYDYKTNKIKTGQVLGFQSKDKIMPTVGVYGGNAPTPADVKLKLSTISVLQGASLYLGETSDSAHVEAIWNTLNGF